MIAEILEYHQQAELNITDLIDQITVDVDGFLNWVKLGFCEFVKFRKKFKSQITIPKSKTISKKICTQNPAL